MQVLIGIALAIVLGIADPALAAEMKPLGDGSIALLCMMLAPIIFTTVVLGLLLGFVLIIAKWKGAFGRAQFDRSVESGAMDIGETVR